MNKLLKTACTRRKLLASGAAAAAALLMPACAPSSTRRGAASRYSLSDVTRLGELLGPSLDALGSLARITPLGASEGGRRIELISVGEGDRSVLTVGAPHPNEPIGCLTVAGLLSRLAGDRAFLERSGYRWHFIPAIDVDGLELNGDWMREPLTLRNYMRGFFRPGFARQPEYGFPLAVEGYRVDASTAENVCWQRALELARPDVQSSLHGNDAGGAFYLLSTAAPALAARLSSQPASERIALNDLGEPDATMKRFAPGVFSFFDAEPYVAAVIEEGGDPRRSWTAGRSSAEYAAAEYGTLSMTCEVPLWEDPRQFDPGLSDLTMSDVLRMQLREAGENARLLDRAAALIERGEASPAERALAHALGEASLFAPQQLDSLQRQRGQADATRRIPFAELVQLEPGTTAMRVPAMTARLARLRRNEPVRRAAEDLLERRVAAYERRARLRPVPPDRSVALQIASILTTMAYVAEGPPL